MKKIKYILLLLIVVLGVSSCNEYLEKYPLDSPSDATFWSTESELKLAINGIYTSLYYTDRAVTHVPLQFLFDFATDLSWDRNLNAWQLLAQGQITPVDEPLIYGLWSNAYATIGHCNRLLFYMDRAKEQTNPDVYERIQGEAKFLRAYWYHLLINLYGDVPFTIEPLDVFEAQLGKTDRNEIYNFLITELEESASMLPTNYDDTELGRITKGAALALKARIALINGDWTISADASKRVMDLGVYELYPDINTLFKYEGENNSEEIFTIQFSRANQLTHQTPIHSRGRMTGGYATKIPTQALIDSYECIDGLPIDKSPLYDPANPFENRDPRLAVSCVLPGSVFLGFQFETHPDSLMVWDYNQTPPRRVANQEVINPYATFSGYQYRKYVESDEREFRSESELNVMLIRYAEILLTYAESKLELNEIDDSVYDAINLVRLRAGIPEIAIGKSQDELRRIIRNERKVEFPFEGIRFFDIRRWKIAEDVLTGPLYGRPLGDYKSNYIPDFDENGTPHYDTYSSELRQFDTRNFNPSRDYLWPIPQKELDINPNLTQNPGY